MFKTIITLAIVSFMFAGCSIFDSGSGRGMSGLWSVDQASSTNNNNAYNNNNVNNNNNGQDCALKQASTYITETRKEEIYQAVTSSYLNVAAPTCKYAYGLKVSNTNTTPQAFGGIDLNVNITSCAAGNTNCNVSIYMDKAAIGALRPMFIINPRPTSITCDPKYQAYIRTIVTLSKEVINPATAIDIAVPSQVAAACTAINAKIPAREDYLCKMAALSPVVSKYSQFVISGFDVYPSPAATLAKINYSSNLAGNLVCLTDLIKPSLWGLATRPATRKKDLGVFKIDLVMKQ